MVKVENKETLRLLTSRFMKMNRARNVIAVIAIILTSLLFTSLFVGSVSMILSKRATEIKQFMDSAHASAQNLSEEDAKRLQQTIEQSEDVKRYGSGIFLGAGMDERFGFSVEVRYADENTAESFNCLPTTPDPKGTWSSGRHETRSTFYFVLFKIWNWEDAVRFWNQHSSPEHEGVKELQAKLQAEMAEHTKTKEALKEQRISTDAEHKFLLIERGKRVEQAEKISSLEAEVHDRDMTIMELKAKLYDLMTAGEN